MAQKHSFTEYVAKQFYNELFSAIEKYLEDNSDTLELRLRKVRNIASLELSDIGQPRCQERWLPKDMGVRTLSWT